MTHGPKLKVFFCYALSAMADIIPLLTLDTISAYLKKRDINHDIDDNNGNRFIRTGFKLDMGDAGVVISLNDIDGKVSRFEITCVTHNQYRARRAQVLEMLNERNRERAFNRSMDAEGNVFLEYIAFYPSFMPLPEEVFDTILQGAIAHFQDDYAALEGVPSPIQQQATA
jgi:hypothetical protein